MSSATLNKEDYTLFLLSLNEVCFIFNLQVKMAGFVNGVWWHLLE